MSLVDPDSRLAQSTSHQPRTAMDPGADVIHHPVATGAGDRDLLLGSGVIILFIFILIGVISVCCFSILYMCKKRRNRLNDVNAAYREYYEQKVFETAGDANPSQVVPLNDADHSPFDGSCDVALPARFDSIPCDDGMQVRYAASFGGACSFENPLYEAGPAVKNVTST